MQSLLARGYTDARRCPTESRSEDDHRTVRVLAIGLAIAVVVDAVVAVLGTVAGAVVVLRVGLTIAVVVLAVLAGLDGVTGAAVVGRSVAVFVLAVAANLGRGCAAALA